MPTENQSTLSAWDATTSQFNAGMISDIGRTTIYNADLPIIAWGTFYKSPMSRGDSKMTAVFEGGATATDYDSKASVGALYGLVGPEMISNVAKQNYNKQVAIPVYDDAAILFSQTDEMIGEAMSAIMAQLEQKNAIELKAFLDDYFTGTVRKAQDAQQVVLSKSPTDAGFGEELVEEIWQFAENKFWKFSSGYNASKHETSSRDAGVSIILNKELEYPAFKKLYSETFHPDYLEVQTSGGIKYTDALATPTDKKADAGTLLGIVVDNRAFEITPVGNAVNVEIERHVKNRENVYVANFQYIAQHNPMFNIGYIYGPSA